MKLENQVCTLEQAKKLKELGVEQKSLFYHHPKFDRPVFGETSVRKHNKQYTVTQVCNDKEVALSAFTVAELGMMLDYVVVDKSQLRDHRREWCFPSGPKGEYSYFTTEAQARAGKLIREIEKGWSTAEEANERLKSA